MHARIRESSDPANARIARRFFKTGPGQYGEGDTFAGLRVPTIRKLVREFRELPLEQTADLLSSPIHEERLLALLILVDQFQRGDSATQKQIYSMYLASTRHINNWDLVDASAEHVVGAWLRERSRRPLYRLVKSRSLWERRIAILSTFHFIKRNDFADTLAISALLLGDKEDLIHKAVGWMLREVGKRDLKALETFLQTHYKQTPRTTLRYAIERFPEAKRKRYLLGQISTKQETSS